MKKYFEFSASFTIGAVLYGIIEVLWRGYTHWTMIFAGGLSLAMIYFLYTKCPAVSFLLRCMTGSVIILTVELAIGFIFNVILGWNIWDYSDRHFNIYGQICPIYAFYWFILCVPANYISIFINKVIRSILPNDQKDKTHD